MTLETFKKIARKIITDTVDPKELKHRGPQGCLLQRIFGLEMPIEGILDPNYFEAGKVLPNGTFYVWWQNDEFVAGRISKEEFIERINAL